MTTPPDTPLPAGYRLYDPGVLQILRKLSIDPLSSGGVELYGGATMAWAIDGAGVWYLGCCAEYQNFFKWRVFKVIGGSLVEVPLSDVGEGRGWIGYDLQGYICYSSWQGSSYRPSPVPLRVPGVVPIPLGGSGGAPAPGPAGGAVWTPCIPMRQHAAYNGVQLADGPIDMHAFFGVPAGPIKRYAIRFCIVDPAVNVRGRLGIDAANPIVYTLNTQSPNVEEHGGADITAGADGTIYYSAVGGRPTVWIQLMGWWA